MDVEFPEAVILVKESLDILLSKNPDSRIKAAAVYLLQMLTSENTTLSDDKTLVIIEGLDGTGKTTTAKIVVEILESEHSIRSEYINSPPESVRPLRAWFDAQPLRPRISYYIVGNHIAGKEMGLSKASVLIADRFWPSILAYRKAEIADQRLPEADDEGLYSWPKYVFKPKRCVFVLLRIDETERVKRLRGKAMANNAPLTPLQEKLEFDSTFRTDIIYAYRSIQKNWTKDGGLEVEIDAGKNTDEVVKQLVDKILEVHNQYALNL